MISKYLISKDENYYRAFTDLINLDNKLICSFSEMNKETKECNICVTVSEDRGKNWSERKIIQKELKNYHNDNFFFASKTF